VDPVPAVDGSPEVCFACFRFLSASAFSAFALYSVQLPIWEEVGARIQFFERSTFLRKFSELQLLLLTDSCTEAGLIFSDPRQFPKTNLTNPTPTHTQRLQHFVHLRI
jgi:hypothetical protein